MRIGAPRILTTAMRKNPADQCQLIATAVLHVRSRRANSRSALADLMGLSRSTAGLYVDQLIASGHLHESGLEQGAMGRPKRALTVAPDAGWFAGVEFNAERVQTVRVDFSGRVTGSQIKPLPADPDTRTVMQEIKAAVAMLSKNAKSPLFSIGAGAPGIVDPRRGMGLSYAFIPGWKNVPIAKALRDRFKAPVTVDNRACGEMVRRGTRPGQLCDPGTALRLRHRDGSTRAIDQWRPSCRG